MWKKKLRSANNALSYFLSSSTQWIKCIILFSKSILLSFLDKHLNVWRGCASEKTNQLVTSIYQRKVKKGNKLYTLIHKNNEDVLLLYKEYLIKKIFSGLFPHVTFNILSMVDMYDFWLSNVPNKFTNIVCNRMFPKQFPRTNEMCFESQLNGTCLNT